MQNKDNKLIGGLLLGTGLIVGAATALFIRENRPMKASQVLEKTKEYYESIGKVTGSWIDYDPIEYTLFESEPLVYIGGVTVEESDQTKQYQFACDSYTGNIIDSYPIKQTYH
ncbi:hypothetical protein HZY86_05295 [Aerococcaceae bacterium DSM 111020]|nr:hypothetical protein [Aerococcaceae bacterium DSM 111020]